MLLMDPGGRFVKPSISARNILVKVRKVEIGDDDEQFVLA